MARYDDAFKDEVRSRIKVSQIAGQRVKLKRAGRELVGLSPFTNEKTPSFYVNDEKRIFKCFSSGIGGDVFSLVQHFQNMDFPGAVKYLADMAGLDLPEDTPEQRARYRKQGTLREALETAQVFFRKCLNPNDESQVSKYLKARSIGFSTIEKWGLGYAPRDPTALAKQMDSFPKSVLLEAGLIKENARGVYGFYRDRLMFPIRDRQGRVVSFGARALRDNQKPKYINGPASPVFDKSRMLYGIDTAKTALMENREINGLILSEGYLDVIAFETAGIPIAVAPLGTSVTEAHLAELWHWGSEPIVCLDGDAAGQRSAKRIIGLALPKIGDGKTVLFARMPAGQDPDDVYRQRGASALKQIISQPVSMPRMIWEMERNHEPLDTPERRTAFRSRLNEYLAKIKDRETARHYKDAFYRWTRDYYRRGQKQRATTLSNGSVIGHRGLGVLVACMENPELIEEIEEGLAMAVWSPECRAIFELMFNLHIDGLEISRDVVLDGLLAEMKTGAADILDEFPKGEKIKPDGVKWRSIIRSVQMLKVRDAKPSSLSEAMREAATRRKITKK